MFRSLISVCLLAGIASCQPTVRPEPAPHEKTTTAAWEAYMRGDYPEGIRQADLTIADFRGAATRLQQSLADRKLPLGIVTEAQKAELHRFGVLNDLAAALFVKGKCLDKLNRKDEAKKVMASLSQYPAARVWDTRGFFWAPSEAGERYVLHPDWPDRAPHEDYVAEAWEALNREDYRKAIERADRCIDQFLSQARTMNRDLLQKKEEIPTGPVDKKTEARIHLNGLLNDVGSAFFIKGKAAEARGDRGTALEAYGEAVKLNMARTFDPSGPWFWSPAEAAADRLQLLR